MKPFTPFIEEKVTYRRAAIPLVNVLIFAFSVTAKQASDTFAAGAKGYVSKASLAARMMLNQAAQEKNERQTSASQLNRREEQIFNLLCAGLKNKEIGARA